MNKCHQKENGEWVFCGHYSLKVETLSINGNIRVFCSSCHADLTTTVIDQHRKELKVRNDKIEGVISIYNGNLRNGQVISKFHRDSLTRDEAYVILERGYPIEFVGYYWVIGVNDED